MRKKVFIALRMSGIAGQEKLSGIFRYLGDEHSWDVHLVRVAENFTPDAVREAIASGYDGFIVSIPGTERAAAELAKTNVPAIVMDIHDESLSAREKNIVFIRNDGQEIGRAAAHHLIGQGVFRSYAFLHNPSVAEWSVGRARAFRETLKDHGLWCEELHAASDIRGLVRPIGVLAANDDCAYDFLEYCRENRIRVHADVAILGINNDTLICEHSHPQLSSVQPDFEQEGYLAAEYLDQMMRSSGEDVPSRTIHVGVRQIVRRESTSEISHAGKLVQRAVAFIRAHACEGISVRDVVAHLKVSRRLADLRFRELQGTSIGEAITSVRLAEVKRRLLHSRETIETITSACGFSNSNYLKNLFKRRYAMSMRDFRNSGGPERSKAN